MRTAGLNPVRPVYQPLSPTVRSMLDPQYVTFHDKYVQYVEPEQRKPWSETVRTRHNWPYAGSSIVEVGSIHDIRPCGDFNIRIFSPVGKPPVGGWPLVIWLHGGAFALGNIDSDNDLCSMVCEDIKCVVANVDYRLAPEHPFPAAVEDTAAVLRWAYSAAGASALNTNPNLLAIAGASAGGNLAAVGALLAAEMSIPLAAQVLVVPVIDNTATLHTSWSAHPHAPGLTPARMTFFRKLYLVHENDARSWKASPHLAPRALLGKLPQTHIMIANQDMLSTENFSYASLLQSNGVSVTVYEYEGMPHAMMALSGALAKGRQAQYDVIKALRDAFRNPKRSTNILD